MIKSVNNQVIVIYRNGQEVVALDKSNGKKATARCHPDDKFDFEVGAKLAFDRLVKSNKKEFKIGDRVVGNKDANRYCITKQGYRGCVTFVANGSEYIEVDGYGVLADCFDLDTSFKPKPKFFNGKVVCTESKSSLVKKGKIYEVKNGIIKLDNYSASLFKPVQSVSELNNRALGSFIEIIE